MQRLQAEVFAVAILTIGVLSNFVHKLADLGVEVVDAIGRRSVQVLHGLTERNEVEAQANGFAKASDVANGMGIAVSAVLRAAL
jgi:hypothetical protein